MANIQISSLPAGTVDLTDVIHISEAGLDRQVTLQTVFNLFESTTQHQSISGAGTNTHANIDTHIADAGKHREINDLGTATTDLWSASKINTEISNVTVDTSDVISGTFTDARIAQSNVTQHEAAINHDALTNFVANEHIDHTSVTISGTDGLTGSGTIDGNVQLSLDINSLTSKASAVSADEIAIYDVAGTANKKITVGDIAGAAFSPDGSNVGVGGVGPFKQLNVETLEFRNINSGNSSITVALDAVNDEIDISVNPGNISVSALSGYSNLALLDTIPFFGTDIDVTGDIIVSGTVDGRDIAADGTKLDGIAVNANNYVHPNHSGDISSSGDGSTVLEASAITSKVELASGVAGTDEILVSDSGTLKRMDLSVLAELLLYRTGAGNKSVTGVPYIPETTLSDGATITWNFSTANAEATVTLGGNRTLAMSNIPPAGTYATLRVVQDGTGSRTLTAGTGIDLGNRSITLSTAAGAEDLLQFRSNGTVMQFTGSVGGFA